MSLSRWRVDCMEQIEFDLGIPEIEQPVLPDKSEPNKMARKLGYGPDGAKCKTCKHVYAKQYAGKYFKCSKLGDTNGPGTDIRLKWNACRLYEGVE